MRQSNSCWRESAVPFRLGRNPGRFGSLVLMAGVTAMRCTSNVFCDFLRQCHLFIITPRFQIAIGGSPTPVFARKYAKKKGVAATRTIARTLHLQFSLPQANLLRRPPHFPLLCPNFNLQNCNRHSTFFSYPHGCDPSRCLHRWA